MDRQQLVSEQYLGDVLSKNRLCIFIEVSVDSTSVTADSMACTDSTDCI